jgi:DNA (cytosine-5)-methyltransferase 1
MNELALFAGAGGGVLGGKLLGWRTVCAVELDAYCRSVLIARQRDGMLPRFPIWDDVRTFDGHPWRGQIDVVTGGFPCQDISAAGTGAGLDGERSGLWRDMARIIREVEPLYVFVENAAVLRKRGLDRVLGDLAFLGFDARWGVFPACAGGAPHTRERLFLVAHAHGHDGEIGLGSRSPFTEAIQSGDDRQVRRDWLVRVERNAGGGAGMARRVDRTRAIGNGQVPRVAAMAFDTLARG